MSSEQNPSFIRTVITLARTYTAIFKDTVSLVSLELKLAKKSLFRILIFFVLIGFLLVATWFCLLATLVAILIALKLHWVAALTIVTALNILLIIPLGISILRLRRNLTFPATRKHFSFSENPHGKSHNETIAKENSGI